MDKNNRGYNKAVFKYRSNIALNDDDFDAIIESLDDIEEVSVPSFGAAEGAVDNLVSYAEVENKDLMEYLGDICDSTLVVINKWGESLNDISHNSFYFLTDKDYELMEKYNGRSGKEQLNFWLSLLKRAIVYMKENKDNKGICVKACISVGIIILNLSLIAALPEE